MKRKKFEYKWLTYRESFDYQDWYFEDRLVARNMEMVGALNAVGADGWELVAYEGGDCLMKREIAEEG